MIRSASSTAQEDDEGNPATAGDSLVCEPMDLADFPPGRDARLAPAISWASRHLGAGSDPPGVSAACTTCRSTKKLPYDDDAAMALLRRSLLAAKGFDAGEWRDAGSNG